jgi:threonine aldolase
MTPSDIHALMHRCPQSLSGHHRERMRPQTLFAELAAATPPDLLSDHYGQGDLIESFDRGVADLLGKESAVFMPSGTMCQAAALRIWSDRKGIKNVAFHPTSHLELHERKAYQALHGLHGVLVGDPNRLMTLAEVRRLAEPLAALLIELPQREIGGHLPTWDDLQELTTWVRARGVALHLDGARLWECQPFYNREYADIAALFDTVYVSFYKGLGGIAGAALAGPADIIAESRIWRSRAGGTLIRLHPYVLSAQFGMAERLGRMRRYHEKAREIARALRAFADVEVTPDPPHTNMMHVYLRGERDRLERAALDLAQETGVWMFHPLRPTPLPSHHKFELTVGDATLDLSNETIALLFETLLRRANA